MVFQGNYEDYVNDVCWVSNTYFVDFKDQLPREESVRKKDELKYYQWVPFILLCEALFFYIPNITWHALSGRSGIIMGDLVEAANYYKSVEKYDKQEKYLSYLIEAIDHYVDDPRRRKGIRHSNFIKSISKSLLICYGKFLGNYLVMLYMTIKFFYILNCVLQIVLLNYMLGQEFHRFGIDIIINIWQGRGWEMSNSKIFPKVSMCDFRYAFLSKIVYFSFLCFFFRIREIGNPKISHRYTVQCVLPINLFNQQIFTFIWFWYVIILMINVFSFFIWIYRLLPHVRLNYIRRRILISDKKIVRLKSLDKPDTEMEPVVVGNIKNFVNEYLEPDGAFMLRILSSNVCDFVCAKLIQELWKGYDKNKLKRVYSTDDPGDYEEDETEAGEEDDESPDDHEMESIADALVKNSQKFNEEKKLPIIDEQKELISSPKYSRPSSTRKRSKFLKKFSNFYKSKKKKDDEEYEIQNLKARTQFPKKNLKNNESENINRQLLKSPTITISAYKESEA